MELVQVKNRELQPVQSVQIVQNSLDQIINESSDDGFMQANTVPVNLIEIREDCIIPSFAKDNESTISHTQFIDIIADVAHSVFKQETILTPAIRVSHPIKGRIPEAMGKPAKELMNHEKTLYYERMAFIIEIPSVFETVSGNMISLTIGGVRAYNQMNLYSRKTEEKFKIFIGFKNMVCTNLCVSTDGFLGDIKVRTLGELAQLAFMLFSEFDIERTLNIFNVTGESSLTEHQFAQIIGRMKLYQYLPQIEKKILQQVPINDSQISTVAKDYYSDQAFCRDDNGDINLWKLYNLFTGANKSSYIDSFLDRDVGCLGFTQGIQNALTSGNECWFLK